MATRSKIHPGLFLLIVVALGLIEILFYPFWHGLCEKTSSSLLDFWTQQKVITWPLKMVGEILLNPKPWGQDSLLYALYALFIGFPLFIGIGGTLTLVWMGPYVLIFLLLGVFRVATIGHVLPTLLFLFLARWPLYPLVFHLLVALTPHPVEEVLAERAPGELVPPPLDPHAVSSRMYDPEREDLPSALDSHVKTERIAWLTERVKAETSFMEAVRRYLKERARLEDREEEGGDDAE